MNVVKMGRGVQMDGSFGNILGDSYTSKVKEASVVTVQVPKNSPGYLNI